MMQGDTIAAIATPGGAGGIGVVRICGPDALRIGRAIIGKTPRPRHAHACAMRDAHGALIDRGVAIYFRAPASFTGEDVIELQAHGSRVVLDALLRAACDLGARHARPGEFSERAFLNGKIDLAQAEAIADLIGAGSEAAARAALRSLEGEFSRAVRGLLDALVELRAWLEAALDFPEEEIDFLGAPQLLDGLSALRARCAALLAGARRGVLLRDGLHVVIVGAPNAGKSSLLNALARSDRAIVAAVAGTTRDVLRETVSLDGIALTLADTAGLHESSDAVEAEGMRRARAELARADVAVLVTETATADIALFNGCTPHCSRIVVHNKIDARGENARVQHEGDAGVHVWLSARTGAGLELLGAELARLAGHEAAGDGAFSARTRHVQALQAVAAALEAAQAQLAARSGELAAEELRHAQRALGELTGEFGSEELLGAIFSSFCIGK